MVSSQIIFCLAPSFQVLLLAAILFGASLGAMGVAQNLMVMQALPSGPIKNKVMSGLHSTYAAASLLAPLVVNFLSRIDLGYPLWRTGFAFTSLFGLLVLSLTFWGEDLPTVSEVKPSVSVSQGPNGAQVYFAIMCSSYVLSEILISSWMALYTRNQFGASLVESTWYTAGFFVSLLVSRFLFTLWSPPMKLKSQLQLCMLGSICSLLIGILVHPCGLMISGFFMGPFYPLMMVAAGVLFPQSISQAISWTIALSSLFVVLMHFGVGYISDFWSLQTAFYLGPGFAFVTLTMLVFYEKFFRRLQSSF
jgi:MFS family permease